MNIPRHLVAPLASFQSDFELRRQEGLFNLSLSSIAIVGLARNCGKQLQNNLRAAAVLGSHAEEWCLHIETNDNDDDTVDVLGRWKEKWSEVSYRNRTLNRQQFSAEFAGPRTAALAEYRTACQTWVREVAGDTEYTIVIDWDAWGGWSLDGVLNGIGWLVELPGAYGMASVSLMQHPAYAADGSGNVQLLPTWLHYDAWALRLNSSWDDYTSGYGGWKHQWVPVVGSPPVKVCSAFGGLCIYRTEAFLAGKYVGDDCEHVPFHDSIHEATGQHLYLNPSQRCIMRWLDGG